MGKFSGWYGLITNFYFTFTSALRGLTTLAMVDLGLSLLTSIVLEGELGSNISCAFKLLMALVWGLRSSLCCDCGLMLFAWTYTCWMIRLMLFKDLILSSITVAPVGGLPDLV